MTKFAPLIGGRLDGSTCAAPVPLRDGVVQPLPSLRGDETYFHVYRFSLDAFEWRHVYTMDDAERLVVCEQGVK